jgi:long-chain acyl-CoA synthetase
MEYKREPHRLKDEFSRWKEVVMRFWILMLAILLPFSAYSDVKEPKTGVLFSETIHQDGIALNLAGTGVRSKMMVKVYAGGLYVGDEAKAALAQFKGQAAKPSQAVYDAISDGAFARMFLLHFVRDVDAGNITEAFSEGLAKSVNLKDPEIQNDANAFLTATGFDMKEGQQMKILLKGDEIIVTTPGITSKPIKNKKLVPAVSRIWLGKEPISEDLKKGMLSRLPEIL